MRTEQKPSLADQLLESSKTLTKLTQPDDELGMFGINRLKIDEHALSSAQVAEIIEEIKSFVFINGSPILINAFNDIIKIIDATKKQEYYVFTAASLINFFITQIDGRDFNGDKIQHKSPEKPTERDYTKYSLL
jgi:hypothetical protein